MRAAPLALLTLALLLVAPQGAAAPGDLRLASITSDGVKGAWSVVPSLSADGTRVAFSSGSRLHPLDGDDETDVYVKDLATGEMLLASTSASGEKGNARSSFGALSGDGNSVAFLTGATNLHPSGSRGLMVKDLVTGEVVLAASAGEYPVLSGDGTLVAFQMLGPGPDPRDTDEAYDVYVKDLETGQLLLASTSESGEKANGDFFHGSGGAALSLDGSTVAFSSGGTNLHSTDTDELFDVFVKDLGTGELTLVSTSSDGEKAEDDAFSPSLSSDGSVVAFRSYASNLVPGYTGAFGQVYTKDLGTGETRIVSVSSSGAQADRGAADPSLSADATKVAFNSGSTNLHPADGDPVSDALVKDLSTGQVSLASASSSGLKGNGTSYQISLGAGGSAVAFRSDATNLHPADADSDPDVYVKEVGGTEPTADDVADLSIGQTDSPDPVPMGEHLTYDVRVSNGGPGTATGVTLLDEVPDGATVASTSVSQGAGCSEADGVVRCDLGTLAAGAEAEASIVVVVPSDAGYLTNTATVHANEPDPRTLDNRSSENTDVEPAADVRVSMTDAPDPARVREPFTYTVSVENLGPHWATAELVDTLPWGLKVASADPRCDASGDEVRCRVSGIEPGGTATVVITVTARKPATVTNRVTATLLYDFDPDTSNNAATETTVIER